MQKGTVLDFGNLTGVIKFLKENKYRLILSFIFILGFSFGIYFNSHFKAFSDWNSDYLNNYILKRTNADLFSVMANSFLEAMLFIVLIFSFGGSFFGVILVPLCISLRGFFYGGVIAFLYSTYALQGIAFNALLIIPAAAVFIMALMSAGLEAMDLSTDILKLIMHNTNSANLHHRFKRYYRKYYIITLFCLLSGIVDSLVSVNFIGKFNI